MAATRTVPQFAQFGKSHSAINPTLAQTDGGPEAIVPRHGVVTLFGYGIQVRVDRGHLILEDGIGAHRRQARLPRVGHRLERLVVTGAHGMVSLAALRWLAADQHVAFVMLERDGSVLATVGPVRSSDARLRRAQALAFQSGVALRITRELIGQKLSGQEQVARDKLHNPGVANMIAGFRADLEFAKTNDNIRLLESRAGAAYWSAWRGLPITFPTKDVRRLPDHWCSFGARISPLTGSPRLAVCPVNAILNYCYSLAEAEARLAAAALGLDPGLGVLHVDTPARDSLACDLMEPVRPQVDAFVLDWITRSPLKREWFFEQRNGNCRLMGEFTATLSETAAMWRHAVAPFAEWVARELWSTVSRAKREPAPATRLTQRHKREAKGAPSLPPRERAPRQETLCRGCGRSIRPGSTHCPDCAVAVSTEHLLNAAQSGRVASHTPEAEASRADTQSRHHAARRSWVASSQPAWLNKETYDRKIQPLLRERSNSDLALALDVSIAYAADIRAGRRRPHPRHWQALARLVGIWRDG